MEYRAVTGVWEVTMGCNMRCKHCGSSCERPLPDQLDTEESLALARDIADLGLEWITLSGGEPLIRKDWDLIAAELSRHGVIPNIISNGWMIDEAVLERAIAAKVGTIAISLDGPQETHDYIRKPGSYRRVINALRLMQRHGVASGVITTVNRRNLPELPRMRELLAEVGVRYWQLQIGLPMGNFAENTDMVMDPGQVDEVIDFAHETMLEGRVNIYPADCLGYYNIKELQVRQRAHRTRAYPIWQGCNAGKRSLGILHNGDVLGCTSVRDRRYIEGNIRERPLREIWEDAEAFAWNRRADKSQLGGNCHKCQYGDQCLGGCPNTRLTMNGSMASENVYCSFNQAMRRAETKVAAIEETGTLLERAEGYARKGEFQIAALVLEEALRRIPDDVGLLKLNGFVQFSLANWDACLAANDRVLSCDPNDAYANKGLGLALHRLGKTDEGIPYLRKAISLSPDDDLDPVYDLAVVYRESGRIAEADALLADMSP
ncbi:MAG: radical SAM protein [Candidatus Thiodiazotropha sp. (ex Epidulcina cf. delphinae)]|nr:radical SAM protein [Candidatus Thiodiazotropha sp. (ex Epidulcina cf. delphinae)]